MVTIYIKTYTGLEFTVTGDDYKYGNGVHYLGGSSYPNSIVDRVEKTGTYKEIIKGGA